MCKGLFDPDLEPGGLTTVDSSVTVVIGGGACVRELLFSDHRLFPRWVLAGMLFRGNGRLPRRLRQFSLCLTSVLHEWDLQAPLHAADQAAGGADTGLEDQCVQRGALLLQRLGHQGLSHSIMTSHEA